MMNSRRHYADGSGTSGVYHRKPRSTDVRRVKGMPVRRNTDSSAMMALVIRVVPATA